MSNKVERFIEDIRSQGGERSAVVDALRERVRSVAPDASEEVKYGGLLYTTHAPICGIFPYTRHVSVEFTKGVDLPDTLGVLEGRGKFRRHVKIASAAEIESKGVEALLRQAFNQQD